MSIVINDSESAREFDPNGFLIIKNNPIAKAGVFEYLGSELDSLNGVEKDKIYNVCRPFDDLEKNKDLFIGKPIKYQHKWVGAEGDSQNADGAIVGDIKADEPYLKADIIIYNDDLIQAIKGGAVIELSPGYDCTLKPERGTYNGNSYDFIQSLSNVNHLAVVEKGRSGGDLKILDRKVSMRKKRKSYVYMDEIKTKEKEVINDNEEDVEVGKKATDQDNESELDDFIESIYEIIQKSDDEVSRKETLKMALERLLEKFVNGRDIIENKSEEQTDTTSSQEVDIDEITTDITERVMDRMQKKLSKIHADFIYKQEKIVDAYNEVSQAIGTTFDYKNKLPNDIYKFGYEALSNQRLQEGLDPATAFKMLMKYKTRPTFMKQTTRTITREQHKRINDLLSKHK